MSKQKERPVRVEEADIIAPSIKFFGGFNIIDRESKEITTEMAPKTKQLLIYLLLHSISLNKHKTPGVSTEQLARNLWPDINAERAKNTRGTAFNRLRGKLKSAGFLRLKHSANQWRLEIDDEVLFDYCDYWELFALIKRGDIRLEDDRFKKLLSITEKGSLLPNEHYDWLFPIKSAVNNELVDYYLKMLERLDLEKETKLCERLANIILKCEILNEKALAVKLKVLNLQKRYDQAKDVYQLFANEYENILGEKFPVDFKILTSR